MSVVLQPDRGEEEVAMYLDGPARVRFEPEVYRSPSSWNLERRRTELGDD